jgi:uncharacterized membrane protein YphA (DoxX/SURF4 family)
MLGGLLLLSGFFARVGGILGIATMVPAILTTIRLANLIDAPMVPPLPLPIMVFVASTVVLVLGGGAWSVDGQGNEGCRKARAS